jgi:hypothetical protein
LAYQELGENEKILNSSLMNKGEEKSIGGVGFLVNKNIMQQVIQLIIRGK